MSSPTGASWTWTPRSPRTGPSSRPRARSPCACATCSRTAPGVAGLRDPHTLAELYDWELTTARLAATEPWWEPGTRSGYHAISYGFLVGEVVRRVTGLLPGEFLRKEITGPLGIDFHRRAPGEGRRPGRRTGPAEGRLPRTGRALRHDGAASPSPPCSTPARASPPPTPPSGAPPRSPPPTATAPHARSPPSTASSPDAAASTAGGSSPRRRPSGSARARAAAGTWCWGRASPTRPSWASASG